MSQQLCVSMGPLTPFGGGLFVVSTMGIVCLFGICG